MRSLWNSDVCDFGQTIRFVVFPKSQKNIIFERLDTFGLAGGRRGGSVAGGESFRAWWSVQADRGVFCNIQVQRVFC